MREEVRRRLDLSRKDLPRGLKVLIVLFSLFFSIPLAVLDMILRRK